MSQSLARIIVHTVFSTKERRPWLRDRALRDELHRYLGGILSRLDCQPIIVGGIEDHVHLLSALARTCQPAEMVKEVKRGSSSWIKEQDPVLRDFSWQNGYGIFSLGCSQIQEVRRYVADQETLNSQPSTSSKPSTFNPQLPPNPTRPRCLLQVTVQISVDVLSRPATISPSDRSCPF